MTGLTCMECGSSFSVPNWVARRGRSFCSKTCSNRRKARDASIRAHEVASTAECHNCGVVFSLAGRSSANPNRYCSNACRYAHKIGSEGANYGGGEKIRGPLNSRWKGGSGAGRASDWKSGTAGIVRWRGDVFRRDGRTCKRCGAHGKKIKMNAHHIIPWAASEDARFDISNGVCLCVPCHVWTHSKENKNKEFLLDVSTR